MKNHKGKLVYTFEGCMAVLKALDNYSDRYKFADLHRDLFTDAEKVAQVMSLLAGKSRTDFLESQMKYWEDEFAPAEESASEEMPPEPAPKKSRLPHTVMFKPSAQQSQDNSDERHHSRRNGHM